MAMTTTLAPSTKRVWSMTMNPTLPSSTKRKGVYGHDHLSPPLFHKKKRGL